MDANRWSAASQDPWLITPAGDIAAMQLDTWKNRRLFDYRKAAWQSAQEITATQDKSICDTPWLPWQPVQIQKVLNGTVNQ